ncbi:hypothetical protein ACIG47_08615 [Promicromonospora sp. NPDC052451]|uniref:hypothetical protein n=1 Tax=Promicromonospora sp. NPDC052451 TaxID=3364407 RepID=UPI0037C6729C
MEQQPSEERTESVANAEQFQIVALEMDYAASIGRIYRSDGLHADFPVVGESVKSAIASVLLIPDAPAMLVRTIQGDEFAVDLPMLGDMAPLAGRPVVYLDQQAWSKLAQVETTPTSLKADELAAARWLIELARDRRVILPYSAGHLGETSHWSNHERRYQLGLTIASLSRGWQMVDPLVLRAGELVQALAPLAEAGPAPNLDVWTLAPDATMSGRDVLSGFDGAGMPAEFALIGRAVVAALSAFSVILDDQPLERADPQKWAERWQQLADHIADTRKPRHLTELALHGAFIADLGDTLPLIAASLGISTKDFRHWLMKSARASIGELPALGLSREVMTLKMLNRGAKWHSNDLADVFYLVHAAGYANAVVGERGFAALIGQAQTRLHRPKTAFSTLARLKESGLLP